MYAAFHVVFFLTPLVTVVHHFQDRFLRLLVALPLKCNYNGFYSTTSIFASRRFTLGAGGRCDPAALDFACLVGLIFCEQWHSSKARCYEFCLLLIRLSSVEEVLQELLYVLSRL